MARPSLFLNPDLNSPEDVAKAKALIAAMAPNYGHAANVGEGISQLMIGVGSGIKGRRIAKAEAAGRSTGTSAFEKIMGAMSGANTRFPEAPSMGGGTTQPQITSTNEAVKTMIDGRAVQGTTGNARAVDRASMAGYSGDVIRNTSKYGVDGTIPGKIVETANAIGADPVDLATVISYETGGTFDPTKRGPTTQYGQHRGLIQFGEPQAAKLGVDWNNPIDSQLGANGAVAKYFQGAGYKPGMGMLDLYSAVNAGSVGRYNASDAGNGGAPGTVRDKVTGQMAGHRAKAEKLLAALQEQGQTQIAAAPNAYFPKMMASSQPPQNTQVASLDPSIGMPEQPQQMYVGQINPNGTISTAAQKPGIQAIAAAMGSPAPNSMAAPQQAPAPQQMAQSAPSDIPAMPQNEASSLDRIIGMNTPLGAPQPQGLDVGMLMQAAQHPWLTDTQKTMVNTLLQQEMQKQDPAYQMQQQAAQVGLQKSQLELQQMQNPAPDAVEVNGRLVDRRTGNVIYESPAGSVAPNQPSSIQEYEYFSKLPPDQQKQYLAVKRAQQTLDLGSNFGILDPTKPGQVSSSIPKDIEGKVLAEVAAKDKGDNLALLNSMKAKMPGLEAVVKELNAIGKDATYTLSGQIFNEGRKQLGMAPSDGAIARTKYGAVVANQVLPLLRDTFGAQFTAAEGDRLLATLGDPDVSPAEKEAVLNAFIEQKKRDIEGLAVQTGQQSAPSSPATPNAPKRLKFNPATGELE